MKCSNEAQTIYGLGFENHFQKPVSDWYVDISKYDATTIKLAYQTQILTRSQNLYLQKCKVAKTSKISTFNAT